MTKKSGERFERVRSLLLAQPLRFANQGSVVAGWRTYRGRRLGPYFRLAYRDGGRQRSVYLGRSVELARRVRELLARLQRPRRERRLFGRLIAQVRASLRRAKARLREALLPWNIRLQGFEFRGLARALAHAYPDAIRSAKANHRCTQMNTDATRGDRRVRACTHAAKGLFCGTVEVRSRPIGPS